MTQNDRAELAALQRRAYGPDPDIEGDPTALRRLRELEGMSSASLDPARDAEPAPELALLDPVHSVEDNGADQANAPSIGTESRESWLLALARRPMFAAAAAALLIAIGVVGGLLLADRPNPLYNGTKVVGHLTPDASYAIPSQVTNMWGGGNNGATAYEPFHGLRVVTFFLLNDLSLKHAPVCFTVYDPATVATNSDGSTSFAPTSGNCGAGAFPATTLLTVAKTSPAALRAAYPVGTAIEFVLDPKSGDIDVLTDN